jgi:tetratricopeptide (TPR) repeat protein
MKKYILFLILACSFSVVFAQNKEIDSLKKVLPIYAESDSNYINTLNELAFKYYTINPDTMLVLAERSIFLAQKSKYDKGQVNALRNRGIAFYVKGDYTQALKMYFEALPLAKKIGYKKGIGQLYNSIAIVYFNKGKYPESLETHFKSLKISEEIGNKSAIALSLNNIANIYYKQGKYAEALENYLKSLKISEEIDNKSGIALSLNNIALVYEEQGKYAEALENYLKSLKISEEMGDKNGIAASLANIAWVYENQGNYAESLENFFKSLKINEEIGDKQGVIDIKNGLSQVYLALKNYALALQYAQEGLELAKEIGEKSQIEGINESLSKIYEGTGKMDKALFHYKQFKSYADSLNNLEVEKKTANLQAEYEFDKKTAMIQVEQAKKDIAQEAQKKQLYGLVFLAFVGLLSVLVILFLIFRSRKKIQNAYSQLEISNAQVQQAKEEIEVQSEELAQNNQALNLAYAEIYKKNEDVTASINYAKRIQNAILPFEERIGNGFGKDNFFILFKPKDIVSGDFYWFEEVQTPNEIIKFMVVADCTGHGVPGAFMSMIGNQLLHEIIIKNQVYSPDLILNNLHKEVHRVLQQKETNTNDGMDVVILTIHQNLQGLQDLAGLKIEYAGAMNPLYYVQNGELKEIKATKKAIGGSQSEEERYFEKHELNLETTTTFYLCTDGFQDQFGGENNKKFMVKNLKKQLLEISEKPMTAQKQILETTIFDWILVGNEKQTDDMCMLGIKI